MPSHLVVSQEVARSGAVVVFYEEGTVGIVPLAFAIPGYYGCSTLEGGLDFLLISCPRRAQIIPIGYAPSSAELVLNSGC